MSLGKLALLILLPGGCLIGISLLIRAWRQAQHEDERADLLPRWKAFLEAEPRIAPLPLPEVRELRGEPAQDRLRLVGKR